jgi:hypothetical protein
MIPLRLGWTAGIEVALEITDRRQLERLLANLRGLPRVCDVERQFRI